MISGTDRPAFLTISASVEMSGHLRRSARILAMLLLPAPRYPTRTMFTFSPLCYTLPPQASSHPPAPSLPSQAPDPWDAPLCPSPLEGEGAGEGASMTAVGPANKSVTLLLTPHDLTLPCRTRRLDTNTGHYPVLPMTDRHNFCLSRS